MTDHAEKAARLHTLSAISKARRTSLVGARHYLGFTTASTKEKSHMSPTAPNQARHLAADLFRQLALGEDGQPLPTDTPEQYEAVEAAPVEWVKLSKLQVLILDADIEPLARATGAIVEGGPQVLRLKARLDGEPDQPQPCLGDRIAIDGGEPGAELLFEIQWTHADSIAPIPEHMLGDTSQEDWDRLDPALDDIGPNEALLVQVLSPDFITRGEATQ